MSHMSPEEALQLLKEGNQHCVAGRWERPYHDPARRILTSEQGQSPFAAVLACSDSRVPVELIFHCGVGDIFVIRVAGNFPCTSVIGSLEYAVEHLGVRLAVILGHSQCGAVTAAVDNHDLQGHVGGLKDRLRSALLKTAVLNSDLPPHELIEAASRANVRQSIAEIAVASKHIDDAVRQGRLALRGAFYDIRQGSVEWMDGA
jgi:carbonic anhydrase